MGANYYLVLLVIASPVSSTMPNCVFIEWLNERMSRLPINYCKRSMLLQRSELLGKMGNTSLGRLFREETFIRDLKDEYEVPRGNLG